MDDPRPAKPLVDYDDFTKLDLRVARVLECREHPNADKLLVLQIDLGTEQRQICAGLKNHYKPEELVGKHIVVVANLEPRTMPRRALPGDAPRRHRQSDEAARDRSDDAHGHRAGQRGFVGLLSSGADAPVGILPTTLYACEGVGTIVHVILPGMHTRFLFQSPLPIPASVPQFWWPVPLSDGRTILTLLYQPTTTILEISPSGEAAVWQPSVGYPAPVIFYSNDHDDLVGLDLVKTGKLYACRPDGRHLWTLETSLLMENPLAPRHFHQSGNRIYWTHADGQNMMADLAGTTPENIRPSDIDLDSPSASHFSHSHRTADGSLFTLEFSPTPQITRHQMHSS